MTEEMTPATAASPQPPAPPAKRSFLFLWIALGMVVVLGAGIAGLALLVPKILVQTGAGPAPMPTSETAYPPVAQQLCTGKCFSLEDARSLKTALGTADVFGLHESPDFEPGDITAGESADNASATWYQGKGTPGGCAMMLSYGAIGPGSPTDTAPARAEPVVDLGVFGTEDESVSQTVRVFHTEALAAGFPGIVYREMQSCAHYSVDLGGPSLYQAEVVQRNLTGAPDAIGYIGWDEPSSDGTFTSVDLQYGNLVVRTTFNRGSDSAITDAMFDDFLRETATAMVALNH